MIENIPIEQIEVLEEEIHQKRIKNRISLKFPERLELLYKSYKNSQREREFPILALVAIIIYNLFGISDKLLVPDIWKTALLIRIGVVAPLMILTIFFYKISPVKEKLEIIVTCGTILVAMSIIIVGGISIYWVYITLLFRNCISNIIWEYCL